MNLKEALKKLKHVWCSLRTTLHGPTLTVVTPPWIIRKYAGGTWVENPNPPADIDKSCPHASTLH